MAEFLVEQIDAVSAVFDQQQAMFVGQGAQRRKLLAVLAVQMDSEQCPAAWRQRAPHAVRP